VWQEVTAIRAQKHQPNRVNIFLDGSFAFSLGAEVVAKAGLKEGDRLSPSQVETLAGADLEQRCYMAALGYLGYRARSSWELRDRLSRRGFGAAVIDRVLSKLAGQGLVDDESFARYWLENRESFSPRSRLMLKRELRGKGVAEEIVAEVLAGVDEEASALRAARRRIRAWPAMEYREFRRRLGAYLRRRGFGFELVNNTVNRLWAERALSLTPQGERHGN
jgi:regulatory protein